MVGLPVSSLFPSPSAVARLGHFWPGGAVRGRWAQAANSGGGGGGPVPGAGPPDGPVLARRRGECEGRGVVRASSASFMPLWAKTPQAHQVEAPAVPSIRVRPQP